MMKGQGTEQYGRYAFSRLVSTFISITSWHKSSYKRFIGVNTKVNLAEKRLRWIRAELRKTQWKWANLNRGTWINMKRTKTWNSLDLNFTSIFNFLVFCKLKWCGWYSRNFKFVAQLQICNDSGQVLEVDSFREINRRLLRIKMTKQYWIELMKFSTSNKLLVANMYIEIQYIEIFTCTAT